MRRLASYSLEATAGTQQSSVGEQLSLIRAAVEDWLALKGVLTADGQQLLTQDGRSIAVSRSDHRCNRGAVARWGLNEPIALGRFFTSIEAAETDSALHVGIELGALADGLSPFEVDPNPPRILSLLFDLPLNWTYRGTPLSAGARVLRGKTGGLAAIDLIWNSSRHVPLIIISDDEGLLLHPGIDGSIARDLMGLAIVVRVDEAAAWCITQERGKDWSCYAGAVRLYWPGTERFPTPFSHPLWTAQRLLDGATDTYAAARRLRAELRRLIVARSGLCIPSPPLVAELMREARHEEVESLRSRAGSSQFDQAWVDELFAKWSASADRCDQLESRVRDLETEKEALIESLRYQATELSNAQTTPLAPAEEAPPSTVRDAVALAQQRYGQHLRFGQDVWAGVDAIRQDSSTAVKVYRSLETLARLAQQTAQGVPLGENVLQWLSRQGERASGESQTINNGQRSRKARTWDDGAGQEMYFEHHLKPKEATAPDQCVRIYFDHRPEQGLVVIGWVGRHPID
jgi:hypothetical protein